MSVSLPAGWSWLRLEQFGAAEASAITDGPFGSNLKTSDYVDDGEVRVIRLGNLGVGRFIDTNRSFVTKAKFEGLRKHEARAGDLVIAALAEPVGRCVEVPASLGTAMVKADCVRVRVNPAFDRRYLMHALNSPGGLRRAQDSAHGMGRSRINLSELRAVLVPTAPPNEQRRIVAKLEGLQARSRRAREALDAVPPLLEKLRQSILAAAFRGDLTKDWRAKNKDVEPASKLLERIRVERRRKWEEGELAKMKAKGKAPGDDRWKGKYKESEGVDAVGLPELPEGWCWSSVGELADVGTGATPKRGESKFYDGGTISWVTSGALNDDFVSDATELVTDKAVAETNLTVYPPGTLLLAMYGEGKTRGMVAELRIDAATNQAIAAICLAGTALKAKNIVRLALERNYAEIRRLSMGGVQPNLNLEKVRGIVVPLCPAAEAEVLEHAVEAAVERVARVAALHQHAAEATNAFERAALAKAFRGELVPQDPNDEPADVMLARVRGVSSDARETRRRRAPKGGADTVDG